VGTLEAVLSAPTVLVYEGGAFIWPGVRVGHRQPVTIITGNPAEPPVSYAMETLSLRPLVFALDDFLSLGECDYIQAHASTRVKQSGVSLMDKVRM